MKKANHLLFFFISLPVGLLIFITFSHFRPVFAQDLDLPLRLGMIFFFLAGVYFTRQNPRYKQFWPLLYACLTASTALLLDLYLPLIDWLLLAINLPIKTPAGIALDKLESTLIISLTIIGFTLAAGKNLSSIFLQRGLLKLGLRIGLIGLLVFTLASIPLSEMFFGGANITISRAISWTPWILIFILGNAFNEELLFRGLFLKKLEPFLPSFLANLLVGLIFTLHHTGVGYAPETLMFLAFLLPLALAWGATMLKTDSLWGSFLFHAGADIPVVLAIFSTL